MNKELRMTVRDEQGAESVKPGGTAGCIYILSHQIQGQDFLFAWPILIEKKMEEKK